MRPTAACETARKAEKEELSYKKFDIDPPAVKLPGRQRADPSAVKLPGRQRAAPLTLKSGLLPEKTDCPAQLKKFPAAMCPRAESGSANLLIQQTLRQESCRRDFFVAGQSAAPPREPVRPYASVAPPRVGLYQISCAKVPVFLLHRWSARLLWVSAEPELKKFLSNLISQEFSS